MYAPKRTRYTKQQKGRTDGIESNNSISQSGKYAIKSLEPYRLRSSTIEAVRRVIKKRMKRSGQIWVCVFPDLSISSKPLEVRMGKGKGGVSYWASRIKRGQTLYEIQGVSSALAKEAARVAASKLPMRTAFVTSD